MAEPRFSEVIKVLDGVFFNLPLHASRMARTASCFGYPAPPLDLPRIPDNLGCGLVKCRLVYGRDIESVEFSRYSFRKINNLALANGDELDYAHKSTDRRALADLVAAAGADEVLIVKNGLITDTSFSNVVFDDGQGRLTTPRQPLLAGVKRETLLRRGLIREAEISPADLPGFRAVYLINAMTDLEDRLSPPLPAVEGIYLHRDRPAGIISP
ncbi:MAG: aminotransferase class IV [Candidatus Adiutrix sp.]|jgi:4-amino-4-deoxychorismate lyase|nr:aminotransferase class IV [Candidatus Adiutrix sp.]